MLQFRVFGNPIAQSKSPFIHQCFAEQFNQKIEYKTQLVPLDKFNHSATTFFEQGGMGINVTLPFKEQAFALAELHSQEAIAAGAVNTLSFNEKGQILGDNSDGIGLINDLYQQNVALKQKKILILGAGGAAKGVVLPLLQQNPALLIIANRTRSKAELLVKPHQEENIQASDLKSLSNQTFDVVINATSASLSGMVPDIPTQCITNKTICYDMVYGADKTSFMLWAEQQGCYKAIDGLGMLVEQAARSFEIWHQYKPETQVVLMQLRQQLRS